MYTCTSRRFHPSAAPVRYTQIEPVLNRLATGNPQRVDAFHRRVARMPNDALVALLNDETCNHVLCQCLAPRLSIEVLAAWAQVCKAFRSWPKDNGTECFLGVTCFWPDDGDLDVGRLQPWEPLFALNGQPAMSKKNRITLRPNIYSIVNEHHDGTLTVMTVPWGNQVEEKCARMDAWLVNAVTGEEVEYLGSDRLFRPCKPTKHEPDRCYRLNRPSFKITKTLSSNYAPPLMFKLKTLASISLKQHSWWASYEYVSDRFYVVSSQPIWGTSADRKRKTEPYVRSRYGL